MGIFDRILRREKKGSETSKPSVASKPKVASSPEPLVKPKVAQQKSEPAIAKKPSKPLKTETPPPKRAAPANVDTRVLIRPFLTEKTYRLADQHHVVFEVQKSAN
ncbi:MAG: 50S ribosomal protein L23, partial [Candidatus Kerfeldbacteria bacterium]|nr:50S ribosomal protein L23 [Candidatus Kerfeldbacteria bacterium]